MNHQLLGLIAAAGRGIRLSSHTGRIPKSLLPVGDQTILQQTIGIMRDALGITSIQVLVGYRKEMVQDYLRRENAPGVEISCIEVADVEKGLARGILEAESHLRGNFCVMLGDEIYYRSNHQELPALLERDFSAVCAVKEVTRPSEIRKNYGVEIRGNLIVSLEEKPEQPRNHYLGCGTYLFTSDLFDHIRRTLPSPKTGRVELTDVINRMARQEGNVRPFLLQGDYINVNGIDDYHAANYLLRAAEFDRKSISLVIPAYNEEASLGHVIDDFRDQVDEILVVDNNSRDHTARLAREKGARVITGSYQGYGEALKVGMDRATGDILILTEADGTFLSRDLGKFLEYLKDADMVLGTRTTKQMVEQAANMKFLLRWGNVFLAKFIELLWLFKHEPRLTDVGCTYRGIWKSAYEEMKGSLKETGPEFSPEMIIAAIRHNKRTIEIPITYASRTGGESKHSRNLFENLKTAAKMLKMICHKYFFGG